MSQMQMVVFKAVAQIFSDILQVMEIENQIASLNDICYFKTFRIVNS